MSEIEKLNLKHLLLPKEAKEGNPAPPTTPIIFCDVCQLNCGSEKNYQTHLLGKKHKLAAHTQYVANQKEKMSVFITGFPNLLNKKFITNFLKMQGQFTDCYVSEGNKFVIVQFKDEKVAEQVLKKPLFFNGKKLAVKPRKMKEQQQRSQEEVNNEPNLETYIAQLEHVRGFETQTALLMDILQPHNSDAHHNYYLLCVDLEQALQQIFPECQVYSFGSTVTGLDFKGSDVDAYVYVPYSQFDNSEDRAAKLVRQSKSALMKNKNFVNVVGIPNAKTPIVKCIHVGTKISCDFSFKNMLGVCNSKLIRFYFSLGPRLRTAMVILKCWAKLHDLVGLNGKFSSYAISMLFIFYLQQRPYNAPATFLLQADFRFDNLQEGWNGGFNEEYSRDFPAIKSACVINLLDGFFRFYSNLDYENIALCPFLGRSIMRSEFLNPLQLPMPYNRYKLFVIEKPGLLVDTAICVQDPFEHSHNVTKGVSGKILEEFIALCHHGTDLLQNVNTLCLYRLLTEESEVTQACTDKSCRFTINVGKDLAYLEKNIDLKSEKSKEIQLQEQWFLCVNEFVISVLIRIFKMDISINKTESLKKVSKLKAKTDVHDNVPIDQASFQCKATQNLWEIRRSIARDITYPDEAQTVFEREVYLSNYICNVLLANATKSRPILSFTLGLNAYVEPTRMEVTMNNCNSDKNVFKVFAIYFMSKFLHWFNQNELELNKGTTILFENIERFKSIMGL